MWHRRRVRTPPTVVSSEVCRCRDRDGRRAEVAVGVTTDDQVTFTTPDGETVMFRPLEVGPVRASLRAAVIAASEHAAEVPAQAKRSA